MLEDAGIWTRDLPSQDECPANECSSSELHLRYSILVDDYSVVLHTLVWQEVTDGFLFDERSTFFFFKNNFLGTQISDFSKIKNN